MHVLAGDAAAVHALKNPDDLTQRQRLFRINRQHADRLLQGGLVEAIVRRVEFLRTLPVHQAERVDIRVQMPEQAIRHDQPLDTGNHIRHSRPGRSTASRGRAGVSRTLLEAVEKTAPLR